jgi:hypothetical protein
MMLRAATWGRGIWETPIKCNIDIPIEQPPISSDKTWDFPMINCGDVKILAGATLTINADVEMADNKSITVYRGGKLVINNATIKSYCKEMWRGIIIDGDNTAPQTISISHAYVVINSSNIEDAITGVECIDLNNQQKGGGYIIANNTTFRNNYLSVNLLPYAYMNNNNYHNNQSGFYNCNFIIDQPLKRISNNIPYLYNKKKINTLVRISGIKGLNIGGCRFKYENQVCNSSYKYRGIVANNSSFFINNGCSNSNLTLGSPCPASDIIPSVFSGLEYGIYTVGGFNPVSPTTESFSVRNTDFNENRYGLYAFACDNFYLVSNKFKVPYFYINTTNDEPNPPKPFYGAYLNECVKNYHVEDNTFGESNTLGFIGLYVNNSNDDYKCIYNNKFIDLTYNFIARGNNGPDNDITENAGLKLKCNDFHQCFYDVSVINDPNQGSSGVSKFQGNFLNFQTNSPDPSGNTFESNSSYNFYNECSLVKYYHHAESFTIPIITNNWIGYTDLISTGVIYNKANTCPAIDLEPIGVLIDLPAMYEGLNTAQQQLNSARLIYQIWVDGGNTEALKQAVNLALPYESYELYNNLISKSPYLSDEVLVDAIKREEILPPLMLKMVLLANPKAIYSARIMEALNNRINRLPDAWIDELKQAGGTTSPREQLESEIDYAATNKQQIFNKILSVYAADTSAAYVSDSLIALYQRKNTLETDIDLLYFYINSQMTVEATQLLDDIPLKYTIEENNQQYWENTSYICSMLINLVSNNQSLFELDESQRISLWEIEKNQPTTATALARSILMQIDSNYTYTEPVDLPPDLPENKSTKPMIEKPKPIEKLEVYPNPANDFVTLTYEINDAVLTGLQLIICDAMGKTVYFQALNKANDYLLIVLKDYAKGNYIASIISNQKTIKTCKFIVQ